ncbi:bifunctional glycosyltransferase/CDP-glycerol:glycerophosphate glycerophosphotransferase [Aquisalibacillus elongatus]|uniref:CDP-glycerol glycerophosphotransferase n=1 Tax=Aquisalibacillus elongatus TaxID=485577 RepID=A0A3N5B9Y8_9BACI|nr:CDP-glycerol:glycerophosphate glycerophosphotransferase [Aquisalibacillus elongatus]RPF54197.1 CDP-glycerol glycerophosphotransferase [Aquisalibacillus elongatus]
MKVSVIVPVFNTEDYVVDCLKSIQGQTYDNLEIIVVNDGSTDKSMTLVNQLSEEDSRIKTIDLLEQKGVGFARNKGIDVATGDYIYFVDSDDILHHDAIKLLVDYIGEDRIMSGSISTIRSLGEMEGFEQNEETILKVRKTSKVYTSRTVQKFLYSRTFVQNNNIRFLEDTKMYSDYAFVYKVISLEPYTHYTRDSRYFRRKRLDLIQNPNIEEASDYEKTLNYLNMYQSVESDYRQNDDMKYLVDMDLMNFYRKTFLNYMRDREDFDQVFKHLSDAFNKLSKRVFKKQNPFVKREIKAIQNQNQEKFINLVRLHHFLSDVKRSTTSRTNFRKMIYNRVFRKMTVKKDHVVFESFMGKGYSCNPKAIYEYMLEHRPNYQFIWINNGKKLDIPGNPKQVKRYSLGYYYYMARAKYWVFNTRLPKHVKKRDETVYLQTWHGTPLKRLGIDIEEVQMPGTDTGRYKKNFTYESSRWDYLISPNQYSSEIFKRAFDFDNHMLEYGYPRNDALYQADQSYIDQLKKKAGIPVDKKVILYAPTWRDNQFIEKGKYSFELPLDLEKMREKLSDEYVLVLRLHYLVASQLDLTGYEDFAYDLSTFDDIAELYLISDILVTDYSSVFFDYANLNRPILFYTYDLDDYKGKIRGLYFDIETEVPSPLLMNSDEVIDAIQNIDQIVDKYQDTYKQFHERFCSWENGKAAENVVKTVFGEGA